MDVNLKISTTNSKNITAYSSNLQWPNFWAIGIGPKLEQSSSSNPKPSFDELESVNVKLGLSLQQIIDVVFI